MLISPWTVKIVLFYFRFKATGSSFALFRLRSSLIFPLKVTKISDKFLRNNQNVDEIKFAKAYFLLQRVHR